MTDPANMTILPARRSIWRNLSLVWLIPILAVAVSGYIGWRSYADRGLVIEIAFPNAAGVSPGETAVRYRDVPVGFVERVAFTPDLSEVLVTARIDRTVAAVLPADAQFWVVRPEVSARGITGLATVLSGVYIEVAFAAGNGSTTQRRFTGLETTPLVLPGRQGTRITLRAPDGNRLTPGAPVLHRGIEVGNIERPALLDGAGGVTFDAFIEAPHDQRLTTATRFWDTSGFSFSFGPSGVQLGVGNLASLLTGGIAFDTLQTGGRPLRADTVFDLYPDQSTARQNVTVDPDAESLRVAAEFDESVQGLSTGAAVRYRGIQVGEVIGVAARIVDQGPASRVRMQALMALDPQAFGLETDATPAELELFLESQVAAGLRAQIAAAGVFSTSLVIDLIDLPDAEPQPILRPDGTAPILPSAPSDVRDLTTSAQGLIERLTSLPIEGVLDQAIALMASVEALLTDPGTRAAPTAVVAFVDDARALIGNEATQALPGELQATAAELRAILAGLAEARAAERLVSTLQSAQTLITSLDTTAQDFPALVRDLRALLAQANALELPELVASASAFLESADQFVNADGTQSLPQALTGALGQIEGALSDLREGGAVDSINRTLVSTGQAADAVAIAARDLPQLAQRLDGLVAQAEGLVAAYGARSPVNDEALATLREARAAARAFAQLARTLERSPNSLLFGR